MIIADKIIDERKRNGWSQEELADKLQVSRQSVSKWEGAQSIPDINRIIQMADLFGVSTDYLLKDDASRDNEVVMTETEEGRGKIHKLTMEEASEYLSIQKNYAPRVALGVTLCILSPVLLIVLAGLSEAGLFGISENLAAGVGLVILLVMVAVAVYVFINYGSKVSKYEFLEKEEIDTAYGVDGMVREKKNAYEATFNRSISIGVVMCVLCCVPLLLASVMEAEDYILCSMVGVLLTIISVAVNLFVRSGMVMNSYKCLLQEGDYTVSNKKNSPVTERIAAIYWLLATALYLGISFYRNSWDTSWIIWPVAGVLFAVVMVITKMFVDPDSRE